MVRSPVTRDRAKVADLRSVVEATLQRVIGASDGEFEDLVQCSLEHLVAAIDRGGYRGDGALRVWAVAVTRNVATDAIRRRMRSRRLFTTDEAEECLRDRPCTARGPDDLAEMRELLERVQAALAALPQVRGESFYLHAALGYPLPQVAAMLGISVAAAQSRVLRARREILDALLASGDVDGDMGLPSGDAQRAGSSEAHDRPLDC